MIPICVSSVNRCCFCKGIERHAGFAAVDEACEESVRLSSEKHGQRDAVRSSSFHDKDRASGDPVYTIEEDTAILTS